MSTKTISKRVALATVVALGAGVLSLVSVSSANASDLLVINGNAADGISATYAASVGLANSSVSGLNSTAVLTSSGKLSITATSGTNGVGVLVTGGTISAQSTADSGVKVTNQTFIATTGTSALSLLIAPNAGASSMTVQVYKGMSISAVATSASAGTMTYQIIVSLTSASVAGTLSLSKSKIEFAADGALASPASLATPGYSDYASSQYGLIKVRDAYDVKLLTADNHFVQISATNGAYVSLGMSGTAPATPTKSSDQGVLAQQSSDLSFAVKAGALATTGGSTTVTVSVDGTVIGTQGYTFSGPIAKVTLANAGNGKNGGGINPSNTIEISYSDSLGNPIYFTTTNGASGSNAYPQTNPVADTNGFKGLKTALSTSGTDAFPSSSTATGKIYFTCPITNVTDAAQVDYTNPNGTVIVSNSLAFSCSGDPYTYGAAFDKTTYAPGDIATLTVTFKDSKGAVAADKVVGDANTTVTAGYMTSIKGGTAGANVANTTSPFDSSTNGVLKFKLIVGQPTSSYTSQASVFFPAITGTTAAVTVPYKISIDNGTSLNDVLKGIISLIASINKQIAALAKLVTKK